MSASGLSIIPATIRPRHAVDLLGSLYLAIQLALPEWLRAPQWLYELSRLIRRFIAAHEGVGLFAVIFAEELGIPLPVPGDVAIMWGGYLTTLGRLSFTEAMVCVVAAATTGSAVLLFISRALGHRFLVRYGRFVGLTHEKLQRAESAFLRWGPWAIVIGRLIPGMRIILSAFAGAFNVPYRVFVPSVLVSSIIWSAVFLELGRRVGRGTVQFFHLLPAHLVPYVVLLLLLVCAGVFVYERRSHRPTRPATASPKADSLF